MSEVRESLKPFVGKRINILGCLARFDSWTRNYRDVGRACISDPEVDGQVVADHVWVTEIPHWRDHKNDLGRQVQFSAVVKPYTDRSGTTNYALANADKLILLYDPAVRIPDFPDDESANADLNEGSRPQAAIERAENDPIEVIRQVKKLGKSCGGLEQAEKIIEVMQTIPFSLPQLLVWIRTMKEE